MSTKKVQKSSSRSSGNSGAEFGPRAEFESKWRTTKTHTPQQMMSVYKEIYFAGFPCADRDRNLFMPDSIVKPTFETYGKITNFNYDIYRGIGSVTFEDPEDGIACYLHANFKMVLAGVSEEVGSANFLPTAAAGTTSMGGKAVGANGGNYFMLYLEFAQYLPFVNTLLLSGHLRRSLNRQLLRTFPRNAEASSVRGERTSDTRAHSALCEAFAERRENFICRATDAPLKEKCLVCAHQVLSPKECRRLVEAVPESLTVTSDKLEEGKEEDFGQRAAREEQEKGWRRKLPSLETNLDLWWVFYVTFVRPSSGILVPAPPDPELKKRLKEAYLGTTPDAAESNVSNIQDREVFDPKEERRNTEKQESDKNTKLRALLAKSLKVPPVKRQSIYAEVLFTAEHPLLTRDREQKVKTQKDSSSKNAATPVDFLAAGKKPFALWSTLSDMSDEEKMIASRPNKDGDMVKKNGLQDDGSIFLLPEDRRMTVNALSFVVRFDQDNALLGLCYFLAHDVKDLSCHVSLTTATTQDTQLNEEILMLTEDPEEQQPFGLSIVQMASNLLLRARPRYDASGALALLDRFAISSSRSSILRICGPVDPKELLPMSWYDTFLYTLPLIKPLFAIIFILFFCIVILPRYLPDAGEKDEVSRFMRTYRN